MYETGNPVPSTALEDMADNAQTFDALVTQTEGTTTDRLGRTRRVFQQIIMDMGFQPLSSSFQSGATLTQRNQVLNDETTGVFYSWNGALPKVVPAGSTPATAGGIGASAWADKTDLILRSELMLQQMEIRNGKLLQKMIITPEDFGAVGDGINDDSSTFNLLMSFIRTYRPLGCEVRCPSSARYRITSGIINDVAGTVIDLNKAHILYDNPDGWAVTVGTGDVNGKEMGIKNGQIYSVYNYTTETTSNNGIRFLKDTRRQIAWSGLIIHDFKGLGITTTDNNWSMQEPLNSYAYNCGTNVVIEENGNAISLVGLGVSNAVGNNLEIYGAFSVTIVGGFNQYAGGRGILLDNGRGPSGQPTTALTSCGVYFEDNQDGHILARNGKGLTVVGGYMKCVNTLGHAIELVNWDGAYVAGVSPVDIGASYDFVHPDANSTQINVGVNFALASTDLTVAKAAGASVAGVIRAHNNEYSTLPTPSNLTKGSIVSVLDSSGNANLHVNVTKNGERTYRKIAFTKNKLPAQSASGGYTPNLNNYESHDLTIASAGLTINAPIGSVQDGDIIRFVLRQHSAIAGTLAFDVVYKKDLTTSGAAFTTLSAYASVTFQYSAGRGVWVQVGKMEWTV